ncbi:MAG: dihydrolipoyl dehydrogenase [Chlamydiota bacterium]|nr:dihydrolipoyl dehydrogenase [Chlamydiota bacterium]
MSSSLPFSVVVIGAGPGGYVAAIKAAQEGHSVALIESDHVGGTCLNVGCIPSKTLLSHAETLRTVRNAEKQGIYIKEISFDYQKMWQNKEGVVKSIRESLKGLIASNQITLFEGKGSFVSPKTIKVSGENNHLLKADHVIIATGSEAADIAAFPCDHERILNSTSILNLQKLPDSITIIGGGYIGCEFASLFVTLGVKVTIVEALGGAIATQGKMLSDALTEALRAQGIHILTHQRVQSIEHHGEGVQVILEGGESLSSDLAMVAIGRKYHSEGLNLSAAGISLTSQGSIPVNASMQTEVPGIYAIGDITGQGMLAHVASHHGLVAAADITNKSLHLNPDAIPAVIFTHPEIAYVGFTAEEAKKRGREIQVGRFPFQALGKAVATMKTQGFVEIVADKITGAIIGAQIIGEGASVMISEMAVAITNELTLECLHDTVHPHPTLSEAWLEAALIASGKPLHFPPSPRKG